MSEAQDNKKSPFKDKRGLAVVGIVGIGLAAALMGGGNDSVEKSEQNTKPIEIGSEPINSIGLKDKDASLTVFAKQFEAVENRFTLQEREFLETNEKLRKELTSSNNALKSQITDLTQEILSMRANGIDATYSNANANDAKNPPKLPDLPDFSGETLSFEGLNFDMSPPSQQPQQIGRSSSSQYGPNYFILKPEQAATSFNTKSGGASLNATEADMINSMQSPGSQQQPQYASAAEAYEAQQEQARDNHVQAPAGPRMERITIPAFSFVEVTTLHGVACPVGANSPGSSSESQIPARPVVLPVRGIFRGPNGSSVDVGTIHLMGLCSGRRTSSSDTGRATIRVEQMSYWDEAGDSQMSSSTGYIVDTRDNEQDVYGRLDKASGRTLALESAAAAGSAFSAALSQAEYTNQSSMENGQSTNISQLTGNAGKAAGAQGVAAIFGKIAQRFEQEANAAIDTVLVEPGIRLRFVTDQPINIYRPSEPFDLNSAGSDVLL